MFYRMFKKSNTAKEAASPLSIKSSPAPASPNGPAIATTSHSLPGVTEDENGGGSHGNEHGVDGTSVASGGLRAGGDRRAFQGEERLLAHPHAPRHYPLDPEVNAELLVLLAQQYSITAVVITHYRVKENYVEYVIECVRGHDAWRVYRRYQQFKALDHDLKQLCGGRQGGHHGPYGVVPVLPGSHWMDVTNQSPELVEQRRRYLEIYLQQLLVGKNLFYVARTALFDFLHDGEVPTDAKATGIQPLLGLISTRTDAVDCDNDDDESLRRDQGTGSTDGAQAAPEEGTGDGGSASRTPLPQSAEDGAHSRIGDGRYAQESSPAKASPSPADEVQVYGTSGNPGASIAGETQTADSLNSAQCAAAVLPRRASGEQESNDIEEDQEPGVTDLPDADRGRGKPYSHTMGESLHMSFTDERLPPPSANCAQCNTEFTSFSYPHRCFFCRVQFCSACLQKLSLLDDTPTVGATSAAAALTKELKHSPLQEQVSSVEAAAKAPVRTVPACRQCAENYKRRLDRCVSSPYSGGAYRGMQSTLSAPAPQLSPASSAMSPAACVDGERRSMMLQKRSGMSPSPNQHLSPSGSFVSRVNGCVSSVSFDDFQLLTLIGRGTFGKVLKVQLRSTGKVYAMKIMNKATVYKRCMTSYMKEEKSILTTMKAHPYIVRCYFAFQTDYYLVFVMDYLPGGELYDYLYPKLRLTPEAARFYAAELVLALEHLHRQDIVHRDLKPENVVLTVDGHMCLTDFGLARRAFSRSRRRSFVGSPEYVAPETIQGQVQTCAVDWWSFGIMLYEMLTGQTPFHARNNNTVYDNVLHKELKLPLRKRDGVTSPVGLGGDVASPLSPSSPKEDSTGASVFAGFTQEAAALLTGLLARDPTMRLQDATAIKNHPYFDGVDWDALRRKSVLAPCIPGDLRDNDVRHFKREFVSQWASVPPLTSMTRASIEALTKCFDNFPSSRQAPTRSESSLSGGTQPSTTGSLPLSMTSAAGRAAEGHSLSPCLTLLPPSVLSTDGRTLREPVHFARSLETARHCFHGIWRVVSVEVHALEDGRVIFPWGGDVSGMLVYTPDDHFSLQLTPQARRLMGPVQRVGQLSKEDLCDAFCSYVASFGRFQLFPSSADDGCGAVRHYAEGNLCPNLSLANTVFQYRMDEEPMFPSSPAKKGGTGEQRLPHGSANNSGNPGLKTAESAALVKPRRVPSIGDGDGSNDARASGVSDRSLCEEATKTAAFVNGDLESPKTASPSSRESTKRRYVLRLSTRPQRVIGEDFMAFTSLVFQKVE